MNHNTVHFTDLQAELGPTPDQITAAEQAQANTVAVAQNALEQSAQEPSNLTTETAVDATVEEEDGQFALFSDEGLRTTATAAQEEQPADTPRPHPGTRPLPGMPHYNPDRAGVRALNRAAYHSGTVADGAYRLGHLMRGVAAAGRENGFGRIARASEATAKGAEHVTNAANATNDAAERASDALLTKRTLREVLRDTKDSLEDMTQAGRRQARRLGRSLWGEVVALGNDFKTNFNEVRDANREANRADIQKLRTALSNRAEAARQRKAEREELREAVRQRVAERRALERENRLTPDEEAAKREGLRLAKAEAKKQAAAQAQAEREAKIEAKKEAQAKAQTERDAKFREQQRIDQDKALERLSARYQREQKRKETIEEVKQHARKAGKVALIGAGLVIASPVLAPAAVAYAGGKAAKKTYEVSADVAKKGYDATAAFAKEQASNLGDAYHSNRATSRLDRAVRLQVRSEELARLAGESEKKIKKTKSN